MNAVDLADAIVDEIEKLADGWHDANEWFIEQEDGTYPIDDLRDRIEAILRKAGAK